MSRLIDVDALAEKKFQERECNGLGEGPAYRQGWNDAIDAVMDNEPSAQPEQRWIPCSERLPEEGEDIIVTYVDDEETRIIPVNYDKGTWYDCIFDTALNPIKVIAWMPLPEPYKTESEDKE